MVVLRDVDIDVSRFVRKTYKGEFQVEVDFVESEMVDVFVGIILCSRFRVKVKFSLNKNDLDEQKVSFDKGDMTEEEIDLM